MNIGEAARLSGVNAKAIRYYESIGLLPEAERTQSGYRKYTQKDVERLRLIGRSRRLGFSIEDVRRLLDIYGEDDRNRQGVQGVVMQHVSEIDEKIAELNAIRSTLLDLANRCETDNSEEEMLDALSKLSQTNSQQAAGGGH